MHTDDEARKLFCPMVRPVAMSDGVLVPDGQSVSKDADGGIDAVSMKCVGSDCAMWRWGDFERQEKILKESPWGEPAEARDLRKQGWVCTRRGSDYQKWKYERNVPSRGYCGLAGQPPSPPSIDEAKR